MWKLLFTYLVWVQELQRSDTGKAGGREKRYFLTIRIKQHREPSHHSVSLSRLLPRLLYDLDPGIIPIISCLFLFTAIILKPIVQTDRCRGREVYTPAWYSEIPGSNLGLETDYPD
jgi:hypothetical protein